MKMSNIKRCYNVAATLQQRYLATYNVAATLFGNIPPYSLKVATQRCGNAHVTFLFNRKLSLNVVETLHNLKLLAGIIF